MPATRLNHAVFTSRSDEWESPDALVRALAERYGDGAFALNAAATVENAKAERFYDIETDALDPFPSAVVVFRPRTTCLPRFGVLHRDESIGPVQS